MTVSRRAALGLAAASVAGVAVRAAATEPLTGTHVTLASGRTYWLSGAASAGPRPLVIGLPGTGWEADRTNAAFWSAPGGWERHALDNDYSLALGESALGSWNVGGGWPSGDQDDVQYLLDVVVDVQRRRRVEPGGVFVAGFSAGGALAWRAAATRPGVFAACAMVSGWAPVRPTAPIDCFHVHGTADQTVPIRGGRGYQAYPFPSAADEALRAPRGSRVVLYAVPGGHRVPGWAADRFWTFFTRDRLAA